MCASLSRIDPLSWVVLIDHPKPETPLAELWGAPSDYPVMRDIIHETLHFWHGISTTKGIELAFDCLKSMNALRFAARRGVDLAAIGPGFEFDGYQPFAELRAFSEPDRQLGTGLAVVDLYEGLARYWDLVIPGGLITSHDIDRLVDQQDALYSRAFLHARDIVGPVAFILFPILAYLALSWRDPISWFHWTLQNYARKPFPVPRGNFQGAWLAALDSLPASGAMFDLPYGPMTTYKKEHRRYVSWKAKYAGLVPEDFPLTGHPVLEDWIQGLMALARAKTPGKTDTEHELTIFYEFMLPGNPGFRDVLFKRFLPPVYLFSDGEAWINPPQRFRQRADFFRGSMENFSALMTAAYSIVYRKAATAHACPHTSCPIHARSVCGGVVHYPETFQACAFRPVLAHDFRIN